MFVHNLSRPTPNSVNCLDKCFILVQYCNQFCLYSCAVLVLEIHTNTKRLKYVLQIICAVECWVLARELTAAVTVPSFKLSPRSLCHCTAIWPSFFGQSWHTLRFGISGAWHMNKDYNNESSVTKNQAFTQWYAALCEMWNNKKYLHLSFCIKHMNERIVHLHRQDSSVKGMGWFDTRELCKSMIWLIVHDLHARVAGSVYLVHGHASSKCGVGNSSNYWKRLHTSRVAQPWTQVLNQWRNVLSKTTFITVGHCLWRWNHCSLGQLNKSIQFVIKTMYWCEFDVKMKNCFPLKSI